MGRVTSHALRRSDRSIGPLRICKILDMTDISGMPTTSKYRQLVHILLYLYRYRTVLRFNLCSTLVFFLFVLLAVFLLLLLLLFVNFGVFFLLFLLR